LIFFIDYSARITISTIKTINGKSPYNLIKKIFEYYMYNPSIAYLWVI